jgi:hypothetical protein
VTRYHVDQAELPLPSIARPEPNFPVLARCDLAVALAKVRLAIDQPPWSYRDQRMWRVVFRQMSGWLPAAEQRLACDEFYRELERVELLFPESERENGNG